MHYLHSITCSISVWSRVSGVVLTLLICHACTLTTSEQEPSSPVYTVESSELVSSLTFKQILREGLLIAGATGGEGALKGLNTLEMTQLFEKTLLNKGFLDFYGSKRLLKLLGESEYQRLLEYYQYNTKLPKRYHSRLKKLHSIHYLLFLEVERNEIKQWDSVTEDEAVYHTQRSIKLSAHIHRLEPESKVFSTSISSAKSNLNTRPHGASRSLKNRIAESIGWNTLSDNYPEPPGFNEVFESAVSGLLAQISQLQ